MSKKDKWSLRTVLSFLLTIVWLLMGKRVPTALYVLVGSLFVMYGYGCALLCGELAE